MRSLLIPALMLLALFAQSGSASGQVVHHKRKHVHRVRIARRAPRVYVHPRVRRSHVTRVRVVKDPEMAAASRDAYLAHLALKLALPLYEGHRDLALALCGIAAKEIKAGIKWRQGSLVDLSLTQPMPQPRHRRKTQWAYSPEQMRESDAQLKTAALLIRAAIESLGQAAGDFGGYRASAVSSLNKTLEEIQTCQHLHG